MPFRSGFVCILGRPNAGKSTLLNGLVGEKLAIVSPKPQTTRNRILGIVNLPKAKGRDAAQIVLIDTPGVHKPDSTLGRKMMVEVREALEGCDVVLLLMDATRKIDQQDEFALQMLEHSKAKVCLVLNKIDLLAKEKSKLLPLIEQYKKLREFHDIIPISALKKDGLDLLLKQLTLALPAGPPYFPEDQITDQPSRFMAAEIIRERVLIETDEEIPYATTVIVDGFEESPRLIRISATIYCERDGQKAILIGKKGQMMKKIGTSARLQIEKMLGAKVFLELFVKVQPNWRQSRNFVEELDWRRQLEQMANEQTASALSRGGSRG
jgi:GTPase